MKKTLLTLALALSGLAIASAQDDILINEVQAANLDMFVDPSFNYGGWIEIYNPTSNSIPLSSYYISDTPDDLKKYRLKTSMGYIASNTFKNIWFDHNGIWSKGEYNQIPFKLNYDGGTILISDGTKIVSQVNYPPAIARTSYARKVDGGDEWGITAEPTPNKTNATSSFAIEQLAVPVVDQDAQLFTGTLQVCVNIPEGATLRYTTDGSTPTMGNGSTSPTGIFKVTATTPYRFRLFKDGMLPSNVVTRTYILNDKNFTIPIISVNGNYDDLFGQARGVFVQGSGNGRPGAGDYNSERTVKKNWNMDWDRPVNFEYIGNEGDGGEYRMLFNQEVDLARCGGWSRAWKPFSFKLKAAKCYYGLNSMNYAFFPGKPYNKHKTLQIRNGGNDNNCRIKDAALQEIISRSGLYVDGQQWVPVMHFINGEYRGVLNMREPNNKHFAYSNYGIDTDEMDQFEMNPDSGYVQMTGTKDAWNELMTLSKNAADDDTYAKIGALLDLDEYINYMICQFYLGGNDYPQNNIKGFRDRNDGKFHFVLFDLDFAFKESNGFTYFKSRQKYTFNKLMGSYFNGSSMVSIEGKQKTEEIEFVTLFLNLMKNDTFTKQFADRFCVVTGSVFAPERCTQIVTEMATTMEGPMSYTHATSSGGGGWGGWWGQPQGDSPWNSANECINNLTSTRISNQVNNMASFMKLSAKRQTAAIASNVDGAKLKVNGFEIPTGTMNGYLYAPVTLTAEPLAGYRFLGWQNGGSTTQLKATTLFKTGQKWNYYDSGSLDGKAWKTGNLPTGWKTASASPLGYGKDAVKTKTKEKLPTYYFRTTVTLDAAPGKDAQFALSFTVDDGCIVYVNGTEAVRHNMPAGNVTYDTFASTYADNQCDTGEYDLPQSLFKKGDNVIAVEVHNNNGTSSDALWDATLTMKEPDLSDTQFLATEADYELPSSGNINVVAVYEPIPAAELAALAVKPVMVNEVSAANSVFVNDYFKKNDWIELYNTTDTDIDIAGMYVSDNENKPQKYQIPSGDVTLNTIIPAHGYKVLWADKLDNIGADIHTTFKLAAEGGIVMLTADQWTDTLTYLAHTGSQTFGRYPDGAHTAYIMNIPTIGKTNTIGMSDTISVNLLDHTTDPSLPDAIRTITRDGGITIAYTDGVVNAKSEDAPIADIQIYSTSGMRVNAITTRRSDGHYATARVTDLPGGIYIARALTTDGNECSIKFVRR